eukprot:8915967-Lingulodinium_polyedra.AAC.1
MWVARGLEWCVATPWTRVHGHACNSGAPAQQHTTHARLSQGLNHRVKPLHAGVTPSLTYDNI